MYGSDWKPPSFNSETYKVVMTYGTMAYEQITGALDEGRIVVLGLFITDAFIRCDASGVVADVSDDPERSGHAVLAVGYGLDKKGTKYLLIRNSWGSGWGISGHAWMSKQYIARQVCETAIVG
jgi:C1A family cysteine protease